ncbi:hypothetical protein [Methylobacterium sp. CM6257]|jgi:hypothetical protein
MTPRPARPALSRAAGSDCPTGDCRVTLDIVRLTVHDELPMLVAARRAGLARMPDP